MDDTELAYSLLAGWFLLGVALICWGITCSA
jgi:hypothetical protein